MMFTGKVDGNMEIMADVINENIPKMRKFLDVLPVPICLISTHILLPPSSYHHHSTHLYCLIFLVGNLLLIPRPENNTHNAEYEFYLRLWGAKCRLDWIEVWMRRERKWKVTCASEVDSCFGALERIAQQISSNPKLLEQSLFEMKALSSQSCLPSPVLSCPLLSSPLASSLTCLFVGCCKEFFVVQGFERLPWSSQESRGEVGQTSRSSTWYVNTICSHCDMMIGGRQLTLASTNNRFNLEANWNSNSAFRSQKTQPCPILRSLEKFQSQAQPYARRRKKNCKCPMQRKMRKAIVSNWSPSAPSPLIIAQQSHIQELRLPFT